jgi:hypothetical protein
MRSIFSKWLLIKFCKVAPLTFLMVLASGCISTMTEPSAGGRVSVADDSVLLLELRGGVVWAVGRLPVSRVMRAIDSDRSSQASVRLTPRSRNREGAELMQV